jgi:hypothetical protein
MLNQIRLIPITETSVPFAQVSPSCGFDEHDYAEDEYLIDGISNIYQEDENGKVAVLYPNAPYVNRMLVRRPKNPARFSGNVVVEVLNPSARYDIDRIWVETWRYLVSHGDIYIGITSKGDVLGSLKKFDSRRYAEMHWKNPLPDRPVPRQVPFPVLVENENGMLWDMLSDLSMALRSDTALNPICGYGNPYVYLAGWSQCGSFITRYRETFADQASANIGKPVFDGYFHAGAGSSRAPINSFTESELFWTNRPDFKGYIASPEPFMVINTETETPHTRWKGDIDTPQARFRVYEIAGSSHDNKYNLTDYYADKTDVKKIGLDQLFYGIEPFPMDLPYEYLFASAMRNLFAWVRQGVPAPASKILDKFADGESKKDALGNSIGGLRSPFVDYPTGVYSKYCTLKDDPSKQRDFWGHVRPFSPDMLKALYGTLENHEKLVAARTDELIAQGYLIANDKESIIADAVSFARQRGL